MYRRLVTRGCPLVFAAALLAASLPSDEAFAQAGLLESLQRLDRNEDGVIDPDEITPLARPYLERITRSRRMSLEKPNEINELREAARIYYALRNGVSGRDVRPEGENKVKPFAPSQDQTLVPGFGLAVVKFPYTQEDLDEAKRTIGRYDRNNDGFVDRAEAAVSKWTHRNPFEMDLNKDNRLSRMELTQRYARRRLLSGAAGELFKRDKITGLEDSSRENEKKRDNSQYWRRGGSDYWLTASVLGRFDANRNGRLEKQEAQAIGIPLTSVDTNRDGDLSREELQVYLLEKQNQTGGAAEGLPGWFYEQDKDRDGQISAAEFTTEWTDEKYQQFQSLDVDEDGLLTAAEVGGSKAMVGGVYRNETAEVLPPRKTIISEIEIGESYLIGDLNVQLSITHTHVSYLDAYLTGPDGQRIELFTEIGGSGDHFDQTVFDDQSREPITKVRPPFKGTYLPEGPLKRQPGLSSFNGKSVKGVWQLVIRGTRSERFGMLHSWALLVRPKDETGGSVQAARREDLEPRETSTGTESRSEDSRGRSSESYRGRQRDDRSESSGGEPSRDWDERLKKLNPEDRARYEAWMRKRKEQGDKKERKKYRRDNRDKKDPGDKRDYDKKNYDKKSYGDKKDDKRERYRDK